MRIPNCTKNLFFVFISFFIVGFTYAQVPPNVEGIRSYYRFDGGGKEVANLAPGGKALNYVTTVEQETPEILGKNHFETDPFFPGEKGLTVEMRFKKLGLADNHGQGANSGTLFGMGDGYWSGMRLTTSYPDRRIYFMIGRPQPSSAIGLGSSEPVFDGVWNHVVVSWNGQQMRIYINGNLSGVKEYAGPFTAANWNLRLGFNNAGVGAVRFEPKTFAVYDRALEPDEIFMLAQNADSLPQKLRNEIKMASKIQEQIFLNPNFVQKTPSDLFADKEINETTTPEIRAALEIMKIRLIRDPQKRKNAIRTLISKQLLLTDIKSLEIQTMRSVLLRELLLSDSLNIETPVVRGSQSEYEEALKLDGITNEEIAYLKKCLEISALFDFADVDSLRKNLPKKLRNKIFFETSEADTALKAGMKMLQIAQFLWDDAATDKVKQKAAIEYFNEIAKNENVMQHHRQEAKERAEELLRMSEGKEPFAPMERRQIFDSKNKPTIQYYVSPKFAKSEKTPNHFASIEQARDAIRELKRNQGLPQGGVEVILEGRFDVRKTIVFEKEDSGTAESPIVYRKSAKSPMVELSGGVNLGKRSLFKKVTDTKILQRIPQEARNKVLCADLKTLQSQGVDVPEQLFPLKSRGFGFNSPDAAPWFGVYVQYPDRDTIKGETTFKTIPYTLAQYPDAMDHGLSRYMQMGKVVQGQIGSPTENRPGIFEYINPRVERWTDAEDVWLFGYWGHLWACNSLELDKIDTQKKQISTKTRNGYGFRESYPFYAFNLLEELDRNGEWFLDRKEKILYVIPHNGESEEEFNTLDIFVPFFAGPFIRCNNLSHVVFSGFAMNDCGGTAFQSTGGEKLLLADCEINRIGAWGISMHGGNENGVYGCKLRFLGGGGIAMSGGNPQTLTPGRCFVENSYVEHFTLVDRGYAPAVSLDGVGNRIAHNRFAYSTHHAIRMGGFEHTVEYNEIDKVVLEADDQAGLDMWGDPIGRGNVIRYNLWSNIYNHAKNQSIAGYAGIRLDDMISGVLVYGNVFYRCGDGHFGAVQIHGGKDNIVDNNLMLNCLAGVSFSRWGEKRWKENLTPTSHFWKRSTIDAGIDPLKEPFISRYPEYAHLAEHADRNFVSRNIAFVEKDFALFQRGQNEMSNNFATDLPSFPSTPELSPENRKLISDPKFYTRFGLRPIPVERIGPY